MVLFAMFCARFHILMVSSELQVTNDPGGRTGLAPSAAAGNISRPQMHAEWKMNE